MQPNLTIPQGLDPAAVNLARAIRQRESGGNYQKFGDNNTSLGAYQWNNGSTPVRAGEIPANFKRDATEVGLDGNDFSPKNQDMVAYNKIKKLKDAGKNVLQISAIWNGGDENRYDPNYVTPSGLPSQKKGVYDVPAYVKGVNDLYQDYKTKSGGMVDTSTTETPAPEESIGKKILNIAGTLTGTQGAGEDIGGALTASGNQKLFDEETKLVAGIAPSIIEKMKQNDAQGKDNSRLKNALQMAIKDAPQIEKFMPDVINKTTAQIMADFAQLGIAVGASAVPGGGSVAGRILGAGVVGGLANATNAVQQGSTDLGQIGTQGALGATIGAATGGLLEGAGALFSGAKNFISSIGGKTAEEVLATPESELSKLNPKERAFYNSEKTKGINEEYKAKETQIKEDLVKSKDQAKVDLEKAANEFKTATDKNAAQVRDNITSHLGDANKKYGKLLQEALAPVEDVPVSNQELNAFLDNKYAENPDSATQVKELFGIKPEDFTVSPTGKAAEVQGSTIGELYSKVSDLKSEVSKAGRSGSRALTADEYAKSKAVDDLMSFLYQKTSQEGESPLANAIKEANGLWKEWAPLRDRIFRELKPFDQSGVVEIPFKKTLGKVASGKASEETKNFVSKLEEMTGSKIGAETQSAFDKLDSVKKQTVLDKVAAETQKTETKLAKQAAKEDWTYKKFEIERQAAKRETINKILIGALKIAGIGVLGTGAAKVILH